MYKTTTFLNSIGLKRELVVHLVVGIHVAVVAVDDQVHVSYVSISNFNHVTEAEAASNVASHAELILPSLFYSSKLVSNRV